MGFASISYWHSCGNRLYDCNNPVIAEGAESETPLNAQSPSQVGEITNKEKGRYESSTKIPKSMD